MTTKYKIKGIGCQGCIDSIEKLVADHPELEAKVTLSDHSIEVKKDSIDKVALNEIISKTGHYSLE
ncbi:MULTISPECIES: heavy-metal-associated domain-containing protein [Myroides]|uniref:Heavy-metal-associated domain-containing protein n=1 Tax=Myroides albus TaxID=2562892 RepID=A0A6I3LKB7_9FLAO|nr:MULTISPECIES: heavy-metal-associated domain-containing protein [Myroides]MTG98264.1 heavy-metal-associated domain-containing protein [Myroides albus]MVX35136.1 heavy-metal-associated domain-containing protein [Myroides sp. LoEW2-1]UVD79010.1 heavy-metal-associated domain-containing protein [Myroides albus]